MERIDDSVYTYRAFIIPLSWEMHLLFFIIGKENEL
jgi:hypothetical protein